MSLRRRSIIGQPDTLKRTPSEYPPEWNEPSQEPEPEPFDAGDLPFTFQTDDHDRECENL